MKQEALEKAVVNARRQARALETKVQQLTQAARTAKEKARQAKSKVKLARQEAKRVRRAAKDAKRMWAEAVAASEAAATGLAQLERKFKKARKKAQQSRSKGRRPKPGVRAKPAAPKSPPQPAVQAKRATAPGLKVPHPAKPQRKGAIQVPRDLEGKPSPTPPVSLPKSQGPSTLGSAASNL